MFGILLTAIQNQSFVKTASNCVGDWYSCYCTIIAYNVHVQLTLKIMVVYKILHLYCRHCTRDFVYMKKKDLTLLYFTPLVHMPNITDKSSMYRTYLKECSVMNDSL
jgi:hypothetical protein